MKLVLCVFYIFSYVSAHPLCKELEEKQLELLSLFKELSPESRKLYQEQLDKYEDSFKDFVKDLSREPNLNVMLPFDIYLDPSVYNKYFEILVELNNNSLQPELKIQVEEMLSVFDEFSNMETEFSDTFHVFQRTLTFVDLKGLA